MLKKRFVIYSPEKENVVKNQTFVPELNFMSQDL